MTSKKIAFVSDAIYPYNKGGKETRLFEITTRLATKGYDVHIYCMKWWEGKSERVENGVHLHGICPNIPLHSGSRRSIIQGLVFGLACFKLLFESFDIIDVDHMPFFPLYSVRIVCWIKRKKMIATWHEVWGKAYWKKYVGSYRGVIASVIEQVSVKLPDTICAVSQLTGDRLTHQLGFTGNLVIIPNGIDLKNIQSAETSQQTSDVIFAGRLLPHKNVDVLIQAIGEIKKTHPEIKAIILGEGPEKSKLRSLSKKMGLENNITFLSFKDNIQELYGLIKASKVFVLPSTREGFGLVVLEANACGIPVITIDHADNAAKELIDTSNGAISNLTSTDIAEKIRNFLQHPHDSSKIKNLEKYEWEYILNIFTDLY